MLECQTQPFARAVERLKKGWSLDYYSGEEGATLLPLFWSLWVNDTTDTTPNGCWISKAFHYNLVADQSHEKTYRVVAGNSC